MYISVGWVLVSEIARRTRGRRLSGYRRFDCIASFQDSTPAAELGAVSQVRDSWSC